MREMRAYVPWVLAGLPLMVVGFLFFEVAQAVLRFGHVPRYLVDPDPFHNSWGFVFPHAGVGVYYFSVFVLAPLLACLFVKPMRYSGRRWYFFHGFLGVSVALYGIFILWDATGFLAWLAD